MADEFTITESFDDIGADVFEVCEGGEYIASCVDRETAERIVAALRNTRAKTGPSVPTDCRQWSHYPIMMPVTAEGGGPAKIGKDAAAVRFEVWDHDYRSHSSHDNLPDAINAAIAALRAGGDDGR